jgi:SAM-dependent methyltransferase
MHGRDIPFGLIKEVVEKVNGTSEKECTVCGHIGTFKAFGSPPRWDASCTSCGSLERHRQIALVLRSADFPKQGAVVLHFAPEPCVANLFRRPGVRYVSADIAQRGVGLKLNIESIDLESDYCDVVVCSHVLEHVDDRRALPELFRILRPGGVMIAMVPLIEGCAHTYEDKSIVDPRAREVHFGQSDHVRIYGRDFVQRLSDAGFDVDNHTAFGAEAVKYGLIMGDKVYICRKRDPGNRSTTGAPPNR